MKEIINDVLFTAKERQDLRESTLIEESLLALRGVSEEVNARVFALPMEKRIARRLEILKEHGIFDKKSRNIHLRDRHDVRVTAGPKIEVAHNDDWLERPGVKVESAWGKTINGVTRQRVAALVLGRSGVHRLAYTNEDMFDHLIVEDSRFQPRDRHAIDHGLNLILNHELE